MTALHLLIPFLHILAGAAADGGIGLRGSQSASWEASPFAISGLLLELEGALGSEHRRTVESKLPHIEDVLRPTFAAMYKNKHGNIGHTAVRYTLHRYFVQHYGWVVHGLDTAGKAWNVSSPVELFRGKVPDLAMISFERRLNGRGFGLRDTAAFAATLESFIEQGVSTAVQSIYNILGLQTEERVVSLQVDQVLDVYMASHIVGIELSVLEGLKEPRRSDVLGKVLEEVAAVYPSWEKTQRFMRDLRSRSGFGGGDEASFSFSAVQRLQAQVLEAWGTWRNQECTNVKQKLLDIEDTHRGCVRLVDFYRSNTERGVWQFAESIDFLRQQGILEEANPKDPHVIIPNYQNSQGNCISSSPYFSACCQNECEGLFDRLEQKLGAPDATADEILGAVDALPMPAPGRLSQELRNRLADIARLDGGRVPLHGRLFAQWMHHAYPRECSYPHLAGTTLQQTPWGYEDVESGKHAAFSDEQVREAMASLQNMSKPAGQSGSQGTCVPWHRQEELFVHPTMALRSLADLESEKEVWRAMSCVSMMTVLAVSCLAALRTLKDLRRVARNAWGAVELKC
jgi:hypothetical protein